MLIGILDSESHDHFGIKAARLLSREIFAGIKPQTIDAGWNRFARQQICDSSIRVGQPRADGIPTASNFTLKYYWNASRRVATR